MSPRLPAIRPVILSLLPARFRPNLLLLGRFGQGGVQFRADNHPEPDKPEKEHGDHDPGKRTVGLIVGKEPPAFSFPLSVGG